MVVEQRELGRMVGARPGPTVITVAGIHGNEHAGVVAARRVFATLAEAGIALRGELVAFAGNLASLQQGVRYRSKDLNRIWTEPRMSHLRARHGRRESDPRFPADELDAEDREQLELAAAIESALSRSRGPVHLIDLHTTSAAGIPFVLFGDTLPQRQFVGIFPIPVIFGLEEAVDGVLSAYWSHRGCVTFAVEGGQHDDPATADSLEAVLWLTLAQAGSLDTAGPAAAHVQRAAAVLEGRRAGIPRVLEVVSRHAITIDDEFRMEPGFRNIDRALKGQLLARDRSGEIRAETDGLVIMPLYQGLGGDGYFWGREVSPLRLKAAAVLQRLGLSRLLGLLPGVTRDAENPARFLVDTSVARVFALEVFQLLGYRRVRKHGKELTVERD